MNASLAKAPATLAIDIPGKHRVAEKSDPLGSRATQLGFYRNDGLSVYIHDTLARAGNEVQLTLNGKVISSHTLRPDETGTSIPMSVPAGDLTHGVHVLSYQVKQENSYLRHGTHQATLCVNAKTLSNLGIEVPTTDNLAVYVRIDLWFESCLAKMSTANEVINLAIGVGDFLFSKDGKYLYVPRVVNIAKIDIEQQRVIETFDVGGTTLGDFSPDGRLLYVCNRYSNNLIIIDLLQGTIISGAVTGKDTMGLVTSHDGTQLFVTRQDYDVPTSGTLMIVDRASQEIVKTIDVGFQPLAIALDPYKNQVYIGCTGRVSQDDSGVYKIDIDTEKVTHIRTDSVWSLTLSPSGEELFAYSQNPGDNLTVIDTINSGIKRSIPLALTTLTLSLDGKLLYGMFYVPEEEDFALHVYDAQDGTFIRRIHTAETDIRALATQKDNGDIWAAYYTGCVC
jgi:DNA-binding beta-propeller fold protein YncE